MEGDRSFLDSSNGDIFVPTTPLKPLIESSLSSLNRKNSALSPSSTRSSLLQRKVKEHQMKNGELDISSSTPLNESVYNSSAFGSARRSTSLGSNQMVFSKRHHTLENKKNEAKIVESDLLVQDLDNPYIREALGRLVNKEVETRKLIVNIFALSIFKFLKDSFKLLAIKNQWKIPDVVQLNHNVFRFQLNINSYCKYSEQFFYLIISWNIISCIYKLLKPIDKCLDLPLSQQQRKIIGLPSILEKEQSGTFDGYGADNDEYDDKWLTRPRKTVTKDEPVQIRLEDINDSLSEFSSLNLGSIHNSNNKRI